MLSILYSRFAYVALSLFLLGTAGYCTAEPHSLGCEISREAISPRVGNTESQDLGYSFDIKDGGIWDKATKRSVKFLLKGPKYLDVIMYVTLPQGGTERLGEFHFKPEFESEAKACEAPHHSVLVSKECKKIQRSRDFEWSATDQTECKKLELRVAIKKEHDQWQHLTAPFKCGGGSNNIATTLQDMIRKTAEAQGHSIRQRELDLFKKTVAQNEAMVNSQPPFIRPLLLTQIAQLKTTIAALEKQQAQDE